MNTLSLNPRTDLFRFSFPEEFIPEEIHDKWWNMINKYDKNVLREPIDVINESIQGIEISGISESVIEQEGPRKNEITGRTEPNAKNVYRTTGNPVALLENELTVTFRHTQGFYNYFLLFESWFWQHAKEKREDQVPLFIIEILSEEGIVMNHIILYWPVFSSMDSLTLSYNKAERENETFTCHFKYSDIDFEFGPASENENLKEEYESNK